MHVHVYKFIFSVQQNWAYSNNANLLAAGANNPEVSTIILKFNGNFKKNLKIS
jgi:hypothetical protein